jgi:succinylglutamate desuccinylase
MLDTELRTVSSVPGEFITCGTRDLHGLLGGPTIIHLPGAQPAPPLFISTLLHGNETTGFAALQNVLEHYDCRPPRPVSIFIGNVAAARHDQRYLPGQADFNRIWTGGGTRHHALAQHVLEAMRELDVCACIDIHNNTGRNPHYSIVATRDRRHLALARTFGERVVYATYPDTSCSVAFSALCPAVTLEAGVVGDATGVDHVARYLMSCIEEDVWTREVGDDVDLYHTVAAVRVKESCTVGLDGDGTDLELPPDVDNLNFIMLDPGTRLANARNGCGDCVTVHAEDSRLGRSDFLTVENGELRTTRRVMPAMLTTDCDIIKMDCLCYLMERLA